MSPSRSCRALEIAERMPHAIISSLAVGIAVAACVSPALATDWWLNPFGTGDFPTIQAALASASVVNGDIIVLAEGLYGGPGNRDISFLGKNVTVRSPSGNNYQDDVIIECGGSPGIPHRGFIFNSGETAEAKLLGIEIRHGYVENADGAGIWIGASSPTIDFCIVSHSVARNGNGGGIACVGPGNPTLIRLGIYDNTAEGTSSGNGGGIYTTANASTYFRYMSIVRNHARLIGDGSGGNGGAIHCTNAQLFDVDMGDNLADGRGGGLEAVASNCTNLNVAGNRAVGNGGGVSLINSTLIYGIVTGNVSTFGSGGGVSASGGSSLHASTISGNNAPSGGGFAGADTFIELTIVWGNCADTQAHEMDSGDNVTITCCCVDVTGMLGAVGVSGPLVTTDPRFCNPLPCSQAPILGGSYAIDVLSPCLPANNACLALIGAIGQECALADVGSNDLAPRDELRAPAVSHGSIEIECSIAIPGRAQLTVHDVSGRLIATVVDESLTSGPHSFRWSGRDDHGGRVRAGVYFLRLGSRAGEQSRRLVRVGE